MEDHSNNDDKYERNRIRKQISKLSKDEYKDLSNLALKKNSEAEQKNKKYLKIFAKIVEVHPLGFAKLNAEYMSSLELEFSIQILSQCLNIVGGEKKIPRFRNIRVLTELIKSDKLKKNTLHGCVIERINNDIFIYRELDSIAQPFIIKSKDRQIYWDNRFNIKFDCDLSGYYIDHLGSCMYKYKIDVSGDSEIDITFKSLAKILPKRILFTIPVVRDLEKIVSIPYISKECAKKINTSGMVKFTFSPKFTSRFTHFI